MLFDMTLKTDEDMNAASGGNAVHNVHNTFIRVIIFTL